MSKSNLLIAGATGTNGRALIKQLQGHPTIRPRAIVRDVDSAKELFGDTIELIAGDLSDSDSLRRAFNEVDKAYIVTAIQPNSLQLFENFYTVAKEVGVSQLVKYSGLGASEESPSEVIHQHGVSDKALQESGLNYTILRPNSFHQNMLLQANSIVESDTFYLPLGDARQSIIDVRDIAEITVNILSNSGHNNRLYNLTGPESLNFHNIAEIIGELRGKPVTYVPISASRAQEAMFNQGMSEWSVKAIADLQRLFATGAFGDVLPDTEMLLGRKPTTFRKFAESHLSTFK